MESLWLSSQHKEPYSGGGGGGGVGGISDTHFSVFILHTTQKYIKIKSDEPLVANVDPPMLYAALLQYIWIQGKKRVSARLAHSRAPHSAPNEREGRRDQQSGVQPFAHGGIISSMLSCRGKFSSVLYPRYLLANLYQAQGESEERR